MKYNVVRLDYGVKDGRGRPHQTHIFSQHTKLSAAVNSLLKHQEMYNCVYVVDAEGKKIQFELIEREISQ